ncbi:hypothetical protein HDU67_010338 [Dinochytrium kinnereticum]|nr:hypothetical protein HDU67_010338 [Dinochytrium kinnereticum]
MPPSTFLSTRTLRSSPTLTHDTQLDPSATADSNPSAVFPPGTATAPAPHFRVPQTVPTLLVNDGSCSVPSSCGNTSTAEPSPSRMDESLSFSSASPLLSGGAVLLAENGESVSDRPVETMDTTNTPYKSLLPPKEPFKPQSATTLVNPKTTVAGTAFTTTSMLLPYRQITDRMVCMSPSNEEEEEDDLMPSAAAVAGERSPLPNPHEPSVTLLHRKTNDPQLLLGHTQNALEKSHNLRKHHSELPPQAKLGDVSGGETLQVGVQGASALSNPPPPSTELPSKIKRSALKPEVIEQLSCLAANVTLRLVGTRWRLVMQQQHLIHQHSQQHLPLHPLQHIPNHPSLGFGPSSRSSSAASLSPSTLTPSSPISPYMLSPMNGAAAAAAAAAMGHGMFLTIPQQHLHPLTPPQSPFKHLNSVNQPVPTQNPSPGQLTSSPVTISRHPSTASVSPVESITSTTTLGGSASAKQLPPPQTNSHGSSPLPATYLFHYAHRLRAMVTHALSRTRAPAQIVPYALLIVHRLVSLRTLPEPLATPTRLLLASLMLADVVLRDATTPVAVWCAIGKAIGAGVDERRGVAQLKIVACEALGWKIVIPPTEFEAWLERLKGWVAGAAAAVVGATNASSTVSSIAGGVRRPTGTGLMVPGHSSISSTSPGPLMMVMPPSSVLSATSVSPVAPPPPAPLLSAVAVSPLSYLSPGGAMKGAPVVFNQSPFSVTGLTQVAGVNRMGMCVDGEMKRLSSGLPYPSKEGNGKGTGVGMVGGCDEMVGPEREEALKST